MKKLLIAVGLLMAGILPANAITPWSVSIDQGFAVPVGDTGDVMKTGYNFDTAGEYRVCEVLSVGLETGYSTHKAEGTVSGVAFDSDIHDTFFHLTPYLKLGQTVALPSFKIRPYVFLGGGYFHLHHDDGTINVAGTSVPVESDSDDYAGINMGGGFDIPFKEHYALGLLVRYQEVFASGTDSKLIVPTVHFAYTF